MIFQQLIHEVAEPIDIQRSIGAQHQAGDAIRGDCLTDRTQAQTAPKISIEVETTHVEHLSQIDLAVIHYPDWRPAVDSPQPLAQRLETVAINQIGFTHQ
ncbi:hypothetical protein D3C78_1318730 [compost metagenome]